MRNGWERQVHTAYTHGLTDGREGRESRPEHFAGGFVAAYEQGYKHGLKAREQDRRFNRRLREKADAIAAAERFGYRDGCAGIEERPERLAKRLRPIYLKGHAEGTHAVAECPTCQAGGFGPDHAGSIACRNFRVTGRGSIAAGGTIAHCTCAGCF